MVLGVEDSPVSVNNTGTGEEYRFTYNATNKILEIFALNHSMADELTLNFVYEEWKQQTECRMCESLHDQSVHKSINIYAFTAW